MRPHLAKVTRPARVVGYTCQMEAAQSWPPGVVPSSPFPSRPLDVAPTPVPRRLPVPLGALRGGVRGSGRGGQPGMQRHRETRAQGDGSGTRPAGPEPA